MLATEKEGNVKILSQKRSSVLLILLLVLLLRLAAAAAGTPTPTIISVSDRLVNRRSDKLYIWAAIGGAKRVKSRSVSAH